MLRASRIVVGLASLLALALPAAAQVRPPTIDDLISLRRIAGARMSPDGRLVAYVVQKTNWEENAYETEIWIADAATGRTYRLTNAPKSSANPAWSRDGANIAFTSDRDGKRQLYVISVQAGEARRLTHFEDGIEPTVAWAPDGRRIAFTATDPKRESLKERDKKYGEFDIVEQDYRMAHLWVIDASEPSPEPKRLTGGGDYSVGSFSWSPDGSRIAFDAARRPDPGSSGTSDIYVVSPGRDNDLRRLVAQQGPDRHPIWSPDGTQIAFESAMARPDYYYANDVIAVVPAGGGAPLALTQAFDEDAQLLDWGPDGIYFAGLRKTASHIWRVDPQTRRTTRLSNPDGVMVNDASFSGEFRAMAFTAGDATHMAELYVTAVSPFAPRKLTDMTAQAAGWTLGTREVISWKSTDGTPIEGILYKPVGFDARKKYPLLLVIHGGPTGIDRPLLLADLRTYPVEQFLARGAVVLKVNYRGSAGYGERFRALNVRNLGVGDAWDVTSGIDALVAQGFIDPDRVGCMGWSQGGYISAFLTTHDSKRFKAISVGAGISDWMTYYVNTDIHPFTRQYLKTTPWDDPEIYAKTSPITYVKQGHTPTLIQHGELDKRVPIPNGYELYQGLQDQGTPVRMVVYKGFGHGITKPKANRAVMEENLAWFGEWIFGDKAARPTTSEK